ncbi:PREDICTED: protein THEMIS2 [Nanorana parkeri]|uniref:protein THEMIS2 n=1 Tax=Nanorana parkeri TaxID=125878 RepID=UPI00085470B1|nr:PREDICTED: protein THEMIS2 [Nanorana parkeri]
MDDQENTISLKDFITSLSISSLPRILQIASGVYLQSSVYDISGTECSLSTGDLLKVMGRELQCVNLVDIKTGNSQTLPNNYQGMFEVYVHGCTYSTLEMLHAELSSGDHMVPYWFTSKSDFTVGNHVIWQQLPIHFVSFDRCTSCAECHVYEGSHSYSITIPSSTQGHFYEYENTESYKLEQVLQSPALLKRSFKCRIIGTGVYRICPEYEIKTIMNMRKGLVMIPSSLEVDVIDITDQCGNITFIQPLSLEEVCEHESRFPVVAEILEMAECTHLLKNNTYSALHKGKKIVIHKKTISKKVLAKACKGKTFRFFYIHKQYQGKFRQRPREFSTVYDLWTKMIEGTELTVVVTQDSESFDDNFPSLCIGDHLRTLHQTKTVCSSQSGSQEVEVLVCIKESADDDEDDEPEEIKLPLYMEGHFVEEVKNNTKYNISSLIEKHKLPCEVKVVKKDMSLPNDPLTSFPTLTLEEVVDEPVLLVSLLDNISECFELPLKYFNISVVLQDDYVHSTRDLITSNKLEELMEWFYYSLRKHLPTQQLPPPRPPKRLVKTKEHHPCNKPVEPKSPVHLNLKESPDNLAKPPVPHRKVSSEKSKTAGEICKLQRGNEYIPTPRRNTVKPKDSDSDDGYEDIEKHMKTQLNIVTKVNKN